MRTLTQIEKQYGGRGRNAMNQAIRAEVVGGAELLDALQALDDLLTMTKQGATACTRTHLQASIVLERLNGARESMAAAVRANGGGVENLKNC